ncbi:hypothetical protein D3C78_1235360 [compost metagenome]
MELRKSVFNGFIMISAINPFHFLVFLSYREADTVSAYFSCGKIRTERNIFIINLAVITLYDAEIWHGLARNRIYFTFAPILDDTKRLCNFIN